MKKLLTFKFVLLGFYVIGGLIAINLFQSCQKQNLFEEEQLDPALLNSRELAEYIIAGAQCQQAIKVFTSELCKLDSSKTEYYINQTGAKITRIQTSIKIDDIIQNLNDKKKILITKYPFFLSMSKDKKNLYIRKCIECSDYVNSELLKLGINLYQPLTKNSDDEVVITTNEVENVIEFLEDWTKNENEEIIVLIFSDGSAMSYFTSKNTETSCWTPETQCMNNQSYYNGKQIVQMIHTQPSSLEPSSDDLENKLAGVQHFIYSQGKMAEY